MARTTRDAGDPFGWIAKSIVAGIEMLAQWHLDYQTRHGSQVLAVALGSREAFVLFRDQVYLLSAEDAGVLRPGRMLSRDRCRALFGPKGDAREAQRLTGRAWTRVEVSPADKAGPARLRLEEADGSARTWALSSSSVAEDLCARLGGRAAPLC